MDLVARARNGVLEGLRGTCVVPLEGGRFRLNPVLERYGLKAAMAL